MFLINRRQLAKGVTARLATVGLSNSFAGMVADAAAVPVETQVSEWEELYPGVWKARLGRPESQSPVSTRLVPPAIDALGKLTAVTAPPITMYGARSQRADASCRFPSGHTNECMGSACNCCPSNKEARREPYA